MTNTAAYTPLECLLLFQSLVAFGTEDQDFQRISDLLTTNPIVKDGDTYDAQRLTTESLRQLYLQLLRDELQAAEQESEDGSQSKKRKLQSPPLPTIKDAQQYREKLPQLVDRLYARYRDYMIKAIHEDEQRYKAVQQEIGEIERGEWDDRILKEEKAKTNGNGSPIEARPNTNGNVLQPSPEARPAAPLIPTKETPTQNPPPSPPTEARQEGLAISDVLNNSQEQSAAQRVPDQPRPPQGFPPPPKTGSNGPHGPSPLQTQQPSNWKWEPPYGPPPQQQPPYQTGLYPQYPPQYPQQFQPPRGSFSSPHGLPPPPHHVPSSPLSAQHPHPILLPPPNGIHRPPSSPGMPLDALADLAGQQYRAPSGSPMMQQPSAGSPMMQQPPTGYPPPFSSHQRPPSSSGPPQFQQPPYMQPYPPQPQQYQYPPNQRPPFTPQPAALIQTENRQYSSPYQLNQGPRPPVQMGTPGPRPSIPHTPMSRFVPPFTTGSGTKWTQTPSASTPRTQREIDAPEMEPISPILRPAKVESAKKATKKQAPKPEPKGKAPRRGVQRGRAGSTASSVVAQSHRSHSVMSHADELSLDSEIPNRHVKQEVATPIGVEDAGDTTADELPRPPTRLGATKRKRDSSIPRESRPPSAPPSHVLWTRAFPKISASALEAISGHKNASTFAAPVKERDAPGYKSLILRPQDLKSIRSAITAGHRAATAAAPVDMNPSATSTWLPISEDIIPPKGIINYAQFEKELMRMFANAVMFNADPDRGLGRRWHGIGKDRGDNVGYEIDEDGVVKDTRAMFADVEKIISSLRSAERRSEEMRESSMARGNVDEDEVDELAADDDSHVGNTGTVKRRRKA
ncbi:related to tpa inducible protein [Phialocephala subalpina]|uniref:Related to tpa inducible protein n=1 Tax=Phialocephala subalpina TaxID=576137 RepID=A0A1L7XSQ1_9HELO|nr:related to tpa inducible protein [Phialocephala subalpina]